MNIQDDTTFHALSEYIISFFIRSFYTDEKFQKPFLMTLTKSVVWESGHEVFFSILNLFRCYTNPTYNRHTLDSRRFHGLSRYSIILLKTLCYNDDIPKMKWLPFAFWGVDLSRSKKVNQTC